MLMCIVRLLMCWYRQQTLQVKCDTSFSSAFVVINGVRQKRVLSPCLFPVYLVELSDELCLGRVGCIVGHNGFELSNISC